MNPLYTWVDKRGFVIATRGPTGIEMNPLMSLLEILSFATSHYATGMQLVVVCNYLGHVCNYKFGIV
jgi:hypothetical protein